MIVLTLMKANCNDKNLKSDPASKIPVPVRERNIGFVVIGEEGKIQKRKRAIETYIYTYLGLHHMPKYPLAVMLRKQVSEF